MIVASKGATVSLGWVGMYVCVYVCMYVCTTDAPVLAHPLEYSGKSTSEKLTDLRKKLKGKVCR